MGIYLNPGNDNFKGTLRSDIYVDKTMMIDVITADDGHFEVARFEVGLHIEKIVEAVAVGRERSRNEELVGLLRLGLGFREFLGHVFFKWDRYVGFGIVRFLLV